MQWKKINFMKQNLILIISLLFSFSNFSQGITSIYSFKVENPNDVQTIVKAMTDHFQTDFAKAQKVLSNHKLRTFEIGSIIKGNLKEQIQYC